MEAYKIGTKKLQIIEEAEKYIGLYKNDSSLLQTSNWLEAVSKAAGEVAIVRPDHFLDDMAKVTGMNKDDIQVIEASTNEIAVPPLTLENATPEAQMLNEQIQQLNKQIIEQKEEKEALGLKVKSLEEELAKYKQTEHRKEAKRISKKSRSQYSDEEKLRAVKEWLELEKSKNPITVIDWLAKRFQDKNGIPNVAKSTFYSWKKYFEDRGEI